MVKYRAPASLYTVPSSASVPVLRVFLRLITRAPHHVLAHPVSPCFLRRAGISAATAFRHSASPLTPPCALATSFSCRVPLSRYLPHPAACPAFSPISHDCVPVPVPRGGAGGGRRFIESFGIARDECREAAWPTFNAFFSRRLRPDARPIAAPDDGAVAVQPADCRLMVFRTCAPRPPRAADGPGVSRGVQCPCRGRRRGAGGGVREEKGR